MTHEEFSRHGLCESMLPIIGMDPVEESLELRSMDRVVKSFVEPFSGRHAGGSSPRC